MILRKRNTRITLDLEIVHYLLLLVDDSKLDVVAKVDLTSNIQGEKRIDYYKLQ